MIEDRAEERIAWRSVPGQSLNLEGDLSFKATTHEATAVKIAVSYAPPGGALASQAARLASPVTGQLVMEILRRMKQALESNDISAGKELAWEQEAARENEQIQDWQNHSALSPDDFEVSDTADETRGGPS